MTLLAATALLLTTSCSQPPEWLTERDRWLNPDYLVQTKAPEGSTSQSSLLVAPMRLAQPNDFLTFDCYGLQIPLWKSATGKLRLPESPFFNAGWLSMCPPDAEPMFSGTSFQFELDPSKAKDDGMKMVLTQMVRKAGSLDQARRLFSQLTAIETFRAFLLDESKFKVLDSTEGALLKNSTLREVIAEFGETNVGLLLISRPSGEAKSFFSGSVAAGQIIGTATNSDGAYVSIELILKQGPKLWTVSVPRLTGTRRGREDGLSNDDVKLRNTNLVFANVTLGRRAADLRKKGFKDGGRLK